jgi:hypothetical protein
MRGLRICSATCTSCIPYSSIFGSAERSTSLRRRSGALKSSVTRRAMRAIQVRAATTILELAVRAVELADLSDRVEALEETLERQPPRGGGRFERKLA